MAPRDIGAQPHFVLDVDGVEFHVATSVGVLSVVDGAERGVVAQQAIIADVGASLILKLASCIDERALAHCGVFPEVSIKRREHADTFRHVDSPQFGEQTADFLGLMELLTVLIAVQRCKFLTIGRLSEAAEYLPELLFLQRGDIF